MDCETCPSSVHCKFYQILNSLSSLLVTVCTLLFAARSNEERGNVLIISSGLTVDLLKQQSIRKLQILSR